jgi:Fe2+ or Zn2+ uptake regulation protein
MPGVSLPTVYATLELLEELGLVRRVAGASGSVRYDPRTDEHQHLVCRRCGAVVDVDAPVDSDALLAAARATGFAPDRSQVVVSGLCAACQAA